MKKVSNRLKLLLAAVVVISLASCESNGLSTAKTEGIDSLSSLLIASIEVHSETGSADFFILPHNTEYDLIPSDPQNPITKAKVELGMMLYHDPASGVHPKDLTNFQTYSCASCHPADCEFQPGIEQGIGEGGWGYGLYGEGRIPNETTATEDLDIQSIKTPSALNLAFSSNTLWNGSLGAHGLNEGTEYLWVDFPQTLNARGFEGLETQVFAGMEVHRVGLFDGWVDQYGYTKYFDAAFPEIPEKERYTEYNMALAIAAYERTMTTSEAPFQDFLRGDYTALTEAQKLGGILFFDKANCASCHCSKSLGNDKRFMSIGMNDLDSTRNLLITEQMGRGGFTKNADDNYKFKVPQLYNLMGVNEYGHGSSMHSLRAMVTYCSKGEPENKNVPIANISKGFNNKNLSKTELDHLEDFVRSALYDSDIKRHQPSNVMSGFSFPNADIQSKIDFGLR